MASGLETAGDVATGAMIATAVERHDGKYGESGQGACLNCGTLLAGAYCQDCGQNSHLHRTIAGFGHDLLHGVFHFEGKIWHTLPLLLLRPGELTRRYINGERAKFVSPLAGFLFCTFLMFAVVGGLAGELHVNPETSAAGGGAGNIQVSSPEALQKAIDETEARIKMARARIAAEGKAGRDTDMLEKQLDGLEARAEALHKAALLMPGVKTRTRSGGDALRGVKTGWTALDHGLERANENPGLFLYRLQSSAYKYSWALIPLSTPLVWLLFFWKRQYKVYDHLVFVTFSLTFMSLLVTFLTMLGFVGLPAGFIVLIALVAPPWHVYRQLRGAYQIQPWSAALRTTALLVLGGAVLTAYIVMLLAMGVFH